MARVRVPLNNFQFGEVSPALTSRTDTKVYTNAAEQVRNFFIRSEGGLKKRTGTKRWANFGSNPAHSSDLRQSVRIEPLADLKNKGVPPTERKALTGEFTPPGINN